MQIADLTEGSDIMLTTKDGFSMRGNYVGYVSSCMRHEFVIDLAQGCSTTVLFDTKSTASYSFERVE